MVNQANLNSDKTEGIEIVLDTPSHIRQVTYNVSGNIGISRIKNAITEEPVPAVHTSI